MGSGCKRGKEDFVVIDFIKLVSREIKSQRQTRQGRALLRARNHPWETGDYECLMSKQKRMGKKLMEKMDEK